MATKYNLSTEAGNSLNGTVWTDRDEMLRAIRAEFPSADEDNSGFSASLYDADGNPGEVVATWGEE